MPGVKTRKGAIQETKKVICPDCEKERKPIIFMSGGKMKKGCRSCDCGVFNRVGEKIHTYSD